MCRIAGYWDFRDSRPYDAEKVIQEMRDTMVYGGPDDAGFYINKKKNIALGHRRLSIIDLTSCGHQPMKDSRKGIWVTYNGEIYNFNEIKKELIKKGYTFISTSDTEVILKAYQEWGMSSLEKFKGMFAYALWDEDKEKLIIVRDRAGVKPLYYSFQDGIFIFASELKAFSKFPGFRKNINFDALMLFLQFGYITAPYSIFKNVQKLEPGHYIELNKDQELKKVKYWDVATYYNRPRLKMQEDEIEHHLEQLMITSFKYRLVSDVPVGIFLSGGLDSSAVTALLQKNAASRLKTFTIGFHDPDYNEAGYAKQIAQQLDTDHTELYCTVHDMFSILDKFEEIYDEPFGDSSGLPTYLVSQLARQQVKVALSADGGDEVFAGYTKYEIVQKYYRYLSRIPFVLRILSAEVLELFSPELVEKLYHHIGRLLPLPRFMNFKDKFHKFRNIIREDKLNEIFKMSGSYARKEQIRRLFLHPQNHPVRTMFDDRTHINSMDSLSYMQNIDFKTYMPDDILVKVDRATMQNSLEGREPFLDNELVEYLAQLPADVKYKNNQTKWILRKILYKYLPEKLLNRPKMGFGIPIYKWLRENIIKSNSDEFNSAFMDRQNIFNTRHISSLIESFVQGRSLNAHFIWFIYIFQRWYKKWM